MPQATFAGHRRRAPGPLPLLLSVIGNVGLFASAWYGGHLVYHHGMRVRGTELSGTPDEAKIPGDARLERALTSAVE